MLIFAALLVPSCSEEDLDSVSIFNPTSPVRNEFDNWIMNNYTQTYNIDLKYKFDDVESDMKYHVTPADYNKSIALAKLVKYLWMDVYVELAGKDFLSAYCPKIMHFIGSPEYEQSGGSMVLGTAEGGLKITLFNVNALDIKEPDPEILNEWYFKTMHHEFAHILHQTKNYSTDFKEITPGKYTGPGWVNLPIAEARQSGFITSYASTAVDEDFVETIANYVVYSDAKWEAALVQAGKEGAALIQKKLEMVTEYLSETWHIDIEELHKLVQEKQKHIGELDLEHL